MSVSKKFASSAFWLVLGTSFGNISGILVFFVLARLLKPAEFGIVALASIFVDVSRIMVSAGIPEAMIQRETWDDKVASTAFWTSLTLAGALCAVLIGVVAPISSAYYDPTLGPVVAALSLMLFIDSISIVHLAKLQREFRYKLVATRTMISNIAGGALGIALAYHGYGVWALVITRLVVGSFEAIVNWVSAKWHPQFFFSREALRSFFGSSMHLLGGQLLATANGHIAAFVVGMAYGPAAIAQYRVGARGLSMVVELTINPLQKVALSAFSRVQGEARGVGKAYLRLTKACSLASCPVFFGAAAIAPDFVAVCFGPQWEISGQVMAMLGLVVAPATLLYFLYPALTAIGRTQFVLFSNIAAFLTNLAVSLVTVGFGVVQVAAGSTIRAHVTLPFALLLLKRGLHVEWRDAILGILPPFIASAIMALVVALVRHWFLMDWHIVPRLVAMVALGAVVYPLVLLVVGRRFLSENFGEFRAMLPSALRKGPFR
jgi:PST family polysaccharide transporter